MKLYCIVRADLPMAYAACQAGHAVAAWLLEYGQGSWRNNTLIYLQVRDEVELLEWYGKLGCVGFREPDIGDQLTAIIHLSDGKVFRKLKLFGS